MRKYGTPNPTAAERRFASTFLPSDMVGVRATATRMRPNGRVDSWIKVLAIDTPVMRRLSILLADQIAGGVTDVHIDASDVAEANANGFGLLVRLANQMRALPPHAGTRGTLTIENAPPSVATAIDLLGIADVLPYTPAFPTLPHSPEAYT